METKTQALQDALELCVKEMCNYCRNEAISRGLELTCVDGCEAYKIAQAALAAPPRQCDVGTAEEQKERYFELKKRYIANLTRCPHAGYAAFFPDSLEWAQMPYKAEEGGAK